MGNMEAVTAREAGSRFEAMVEESFVVLIPDRDDFDRAREWVGRAEISLRVPDALHLAIAANRNAGAIYSLDKLMIAAGESLGLPTSAGTVPGYSD